MSLVCMWPIVAQRTHPNQIAAVDRADSAFNFVSFVFVCLDGDFERFGFALQLVRNFVWNRISTKSKID